jgi:hypothetical protein
MRLNYKKKKKEKVIMVPVNDSGNRRKCIMIKNELESNE